MNSKRTLGLLILICGIAMIVMAQYIKNRVEQGKEQISSAQKKVKQANSLFSLSPVTKEVGQGVTGSVQKKIDEGKEQVLHYMDFANWLQIGGIVLVILGPVVMFVGRKK